LPQPRPRLAPTAALLALALATGCGGGASSGPESLVVDLQYPAFQAYLWHPVTLRPTVTGLGGRPASFRLRSGTLPAGLALDPATGTIAGTPTAAGSTMLEVELTVPGLEGAVVMARELPVAGPAVEYQGLQAPGLWVAETRQCPVGYPSWPMSGMAPWAPGAGETITYTLLGGALPPGISLDPASGTLSGTPAATGVSTFQVRATVTRPGGPFVFDSGTLQLEVRDPCRLSYPFNTAAPANSTVSVAPFLDCSQAGWRDATFRFSVQGWGGYAATLPDALQLDPDTGVISGVLKPMGLSTVYTGIKLTVTHGGLSYDKLTGAGFYAMP